MARDVPNIPRNLQTCLILGKIPDTGRGKGPDIVKRVRGESMFQLVVREILRHVPMCFGSLSVFGSLPPLIKPKSKKLLSTPLLLSYDN